MKKLLVVLVLILLIGAGAAFVLTRNATQQSDNTSLEVPIDTLNTAATPSSSLTSSNITSMGVGMVEQNASGQFGGVEFVEVDGKTKVTISVDPASFTEPQPAHIHLGSCPTPGAVKYPLANVVNGKSETTLDTSLSALVADLPLAVNIHKSASEASVYTSCGDLIAPEE